MFYSSLQAIAEAATPTGKFLPWTNVPVASVRAALERLRPGGWSSFQKLVLTLDWAAVPWCGRPLSRVPLQKRIELLERLNRGPMTALVRGVTAPIKLARFDELQARKTPSLPMTATAVLQPNPGSRHGSQIVDARDLEEDDELEADVVIVGSGAGGAPMAAALAKRGHGVIVLEEGGHFTRHDFSPNPFENQRRLYRNGAATFTFGNTFIPVPFGKTVGGTTTVNSGTCFRLPERVLHRWQTEDGLFELGRGSLDTYYERAEKMLEVSACATDVLSGNARLIRQGADALGWSHAPLLRNAPDCDGQGVCCFGCPTDAKRSTNVSYMPAALKAGAMLFSHARATQVLIERGQAAGVVAYARRQNGTRVRLVIRASSVVLACGAIHTPALLLGQGIANRSGQVGKNLTVHPTGHAFARFSHEVKGWSGVPQGYSVNEFADQGIRFEGGNLPMSMSASMMAEVGPAWTELVENFDKLAMFGFMIAETSRGRVRLDPRGLPQMHYHLNDRDRRTMIRAQGLLARLFLAAGAEHVYPAMRHFGKLSSLSDVKRMERLAPDQVRAHQLDVAAFHPLGTCRMGSDPTQSVVGHTHEAHDLPGLFISDGSTVNGPLGVNPQLTIMAMSERASDFVEKRIDGRLPSETVSVLDDQWEFKETMAGTYRRCGEHGEVTGAPKKLSFTVVARGTPDIKNDGELEIHGELTMEGFATKVPCAGRLTIRPHRRRATLSYDLECTADDGQPLSLHGDKHVGLNIVRGMTTLYTEVTSGPESIGRGVLLFDLKTLPTWIQSFHRGPRT